MNASDTLARFMKSGQSNRGPRAGYFSLTKDRPNAVVWLHKRQPPEMIWMHQFPGELRYKDADGTEVQKIIMEDVPCLGRDGCPICKLIAHVRTQVTLGQLAVNATVLRYTTPWSNVETPAAMFSGLADKKYPEIYDQCIKAKLFMGDLYKHDAKARAKWVTLLVDNANVNGGLQMTKFSKQLGDSIGAAITAAIEGAARPEEGNPFENPYAFKVEYFPNAKIPEPSYKALAMSPKKYELTTEIENLLVAEVPDNYTRALQPPNMQKLALSFERFLTIPVPMETIFGAVAEPRQAPPMQYTPQAEAPPAPVLTRVLKREPVKEEEPAPVEVTPVDVAPCEKCGVPFDINATQCPSCGQSFDIPGKDIFADSDLPF